MIQDRKQQTTVYEPNLSCCLVLYSEQIKILKIFLSDSKSKNNNNISEDMKIIWNPSVSIPG